MKKTVKFNGTEDDKVAYLTAVFSPKRKEKLKNYLRLIKSSVQLGEINTDEADKRFFEQQMGRGDRFARVEIREDKIILRLRYVSDTGSWGGNGIDDTERDAFHIVEQIETLLDAFEEEAD